MSSALVVFSGGQDSTTCLFWALKHFDEVRALTFRYGQRHEIEISLAHDIAREAGVPWGCGIGVFGLRDRLWIAAAWNRRGHDQRLQAESSCEPLYR